MFVSAFLHGDGTMACCLSLITPVETFRPRLVVMGDESCVMNFSHNKAVHALRLFMALAISLLASFSFMVSLFSKSFLPLARAISIFA